MEVTLYVGNLAYTTTENELRTLFAQAGNVTTVDLIKDRDSGQSKGFAFVTMGTRTEAQQAIGMFHAFSLAHRRLKVQAVKPRAAPGGYQSRLSAFGLAGQNVNTRKPKAAPSGYQSRLGAFGNGNSPTGHRRRSGSQR